MNAAYGLLFFALFQPLLGFTDSVEISPSIEVLPLFGDQGKASFPDRDAVQSVLMSGTKRAEKLSELINEESESCFIPEVDPNNQTVVFRLHNAVSLKNRVLCIAKGEKSINWLEAGAYRYSKQPISPDMSLSNHVFDAVEYVRDGYRIVRWLIKYIDPSTSHVPVRQHAPPKGRSSGSSADGGDRSETTEHSTFQASVTVHHGRDSVISSSGGGGGRPPERPNQQDNKGPHDRYLYVDIGRAEKSCDDPRNNRRREGITHQTSARLAGIGGDTAFFDDSESPCHASKAPLNARKGISSRNTSLDGGKATSRQRRGGGYTPSKGTSKNHWESPPQDAPPQVSKKQGRSIVGPLSEKNNPALGTNPMDASGPLGL